MTQKYKSLLTHIPTLSISLYVQIISLLSNIVTKVLVSYTTTIHIELIKKSTVTIRRATNIGLIFAYKKLKFSHA